MSHTNATTNYELSQFVGSDKPAWLVDYNGDMLKIDNAVGGVRGDLTTAQGDITDIKTAIGAEGLAGRVTQAENDITSINTTIGDTVLPTTAQTLTGAIAESISDIADVETALGVVRETAGAAQTAASAASQLAYTIANVYDSSETYAIGDYAIYQNTLYKCTTAILVGEVFDPTKWTSVKVMEEMPSGGGGGSVDADDVSYNNTSSGLSATNVQDAIDELTTDIPTGFAATAITYDNTTSGLTANNVQAAIDELTSNIEGLNNFGTIVDIISYNTFANAYTVPSNGYVRVNSGSSASIAIRIYGNNSTLDSDPFVGIRSDNSNASATMVHKGMKIYVFASNGTGNEVKFIPLE